LRGAGAVLIGKTTMVEYGVSPMGYNVHAQGPFNAYNTSHYSGGSSAGSAVAVAAGLVPVAVGFDGGGSIRIPSAFSGVFGISPTYSRVPFDTPAQTMTTIHGGPLAASAADMALAYQLLAPPPPPEHFYHKLYGAGGPPLPHLSTFADVEDFTGFRIGIFKEHFEDGEPEVVAACRKAVDQLVARGAVVQDINIPHMHALSLSHGIGIQAEFALSHDGVYSSPVDGPRLEAFTRINLALAMEFKAVEVYAANTLRGYAMEHLAALFQKVDVIISPTVGRTAPQLSPEARASGESDNTEIMQVIKHIFLGNYLGMPCSQAPVGYSKGLPIGLQTCAAHWNDHHTLRVANAVEQFVLERRLPPAENFASPFLN